MSVDQGDTSTKLDDRIFECLPSLRSVKFGFLKFGSLRNASESNEFTSARCEINIIRNEECKQFTISVILHCDNSDVVQVINKTSSKDSNSMILMRRLMVLSLKNNIHFSARHFPGVYNTAADILSRLQVTQFKMRFPYIDQDPTPVPQDSLRL